MHASKYQRIHTHTHTHIYIENTKSNLISNEITYIIYLNEMLLVGKLVVLNGISTLVGYLMPIFVYTYLSNIYEL